jgi:hypothetical protein
MLEYRHLEPEYIKNALFCCYSLVNPGDYLSGIHIAMDVLSSADLQSLFLSCLCWRMFSKGSL